MFTRPTTNGSVPTGGPEEVPLDTELLFNLLDNMQQLVKLAEITNTHLAVMASRLKVDQPSNPQREIGVQFAERTDTRRPRRNTKTENSNRPWSPEDLALVVQLRDRAEMDWATIGKIVGRSSRSVSEQYHRVARGEI